MIRALFFDLDDTLYPEKAYIESGFRLCARYIERETGASASSVFDSALRHAAQGVAALDALAEEYALPKGGAEQLLRLYREQMPDISLNFETAQMLDRMSERYALAIITDGRPEGQRNKIKALGLEHWVDTVVITDELGGPQMRKPCEVGYKKALDQMRIVPWEAAYIGDNCKKDFIAPNRMKMPSIRYCGIRGLYARENPSADGAPLYSVRCWDELDCIIRCINVNTQGESR